MFPTQWITQNAVRFSTVLVAAGLMLAACTPPAKPDRPPISCYPYQQTLVEAEENLTKTIAEMVMDGMPSTVLLYPLEDKYAKSAMKKAGLSGAAADYFKVRYNRSETREALIVLMRDDFLADNRQLDQAGQVLNDLAQCRASQFEEIISDLEAGNVDRNVALMRKGDVNDKIARDSALIGSIIESAGKRAWDFQSALYAGFGLLPGDIPGKLKYEKYIVLKKTSVRAAPGKSGAIIGGLFKGEQIYVLPGHEDSAWQPVAWFDGRTAYLYIEHIAHKDSGMAAGVGRTSKILEIEKLMEINKDRRTNFEGKGRDYHRTRLHVVQRAAGI